MNALENKIPPPLVALAFALLMWWISRISPAVDISFNYRISASTILFITGLLFCLFGVVSFRRAKTTVNPLTPEAATSLVISGVYRISRNPMYVGFAFFLLAFSIYLSAPLSTIGIVGFIWYMNRFQIKPEEKALEKIFGIEFSDYMQRVNRWL
ncbi:isoprenylcysteine carboxylmethyltransferase family protein [Pseudomaricurvus alcaniphilus]|uniref:methyltransferase family protein n=1 Tax=Pseudomaricurvus alcaniphilus TaxID=1166482 RepID=UPI00140D176E|nr:isoprenylcysteine carboxylmethyltransferase family protein [Pseudomaricurvus alcaniphilus]NHN38641.1 isoprenylcysteine carboxylmethyltransferase family protein [Pseudomaricurvus alcaniphilus]